MDLGIAGRRALVTGASAGLGLETARALADDGAVVAVCSRERQRVEAAAKEIGHDAMALVGDVSTPEGAARLAGEALQAAGGVDILVANVGGPPPGLAGSTQLDVLRESLDRCLLGMVVLCDAVLPGMRERGWGRILAITSIGVRQPLAGMVYSNSSRAGLTGYLKTLAREVIADGVTVNSILPAGQLTERLKSLAGETLDAYLATLPAGPGRPEDFGRVAAFLCSQWAGYVTGVALPVDGGSDAALL